MLVVLIAIAVLTIVLRLLWISYADSNPRDGRFDDTVFYDHAARTIADGRGFLNYYGYPTAQWPPGYAFVLAGLYKVSGDDIHSGKMLNVAAAAATCLLVYAIGAKLFNKWVGLLAALIAAAFPSAIQYTTLLSSEVVFPALLALFLLGGIIVGEKKSPSPWQLLALGLLAGAMALVRSEAAVLLAAFFGAWIATRFSWRRFFGHGALLAVGAVAVVAPWTIRNAVQMDALIPISSGAGHTFLTGHRERPYDRLAIFPEAKLQEKYEYLDFPERELKVEREAFEDGLEYMFGHPSEELQHLGEKFQRFYEDDSDALRWVHGIWVDDSGEDKGTLSAQEIEDWTSVTDIYYYVVMGLFLAGVPFWFSVRDYPRLLLILAIVAWNVAHLLFFPSPRYHAPLIPLFSVFAAYSVVMAIQGAASLFRRVKAASPASGP